MGVDYIGHYGLGFGIETIDFESNEISKDVKELETMWDLLDEKIDFDKYNWFEVGEGSYTGEENEFYIIIKEPSFTCMEKLTKERDELIKHIYKIGLNVNTGFGVFGGLEVY